MFVICDIGPSCLPSSDVMLLKTAERATLRNKKQNNQPLNFFLQDINIVEFFNHIVITCNI
jgi:hypothetical protein